ncbi:MAG: PAS domain S-box protein, partial [Promethearchaeota archaeon]
KKLKESEEKYRTLTEQSFLGISILQDDIIQYVNSQLANLFGYTVEEIMAWEKGGFLNIIYPDDRKLIAEQAEKKQAGDSDIIPQYQFRGIKKNGDILWLEIFSKSINYRGRPADFVTIHDITEKKISEQKIRESEEKYRSIFENMTEGFAYHEVIVDENNEPIDYRYLEVNPAFEKLTGLKAEHMIGKKVTEVLPGTENDPADWIGRFGKVGLTGIPLEVEDYSEALDKWFKVSGYSPQKGYFAVTFSDITHQKKAEIVVAESEEKYRNLFNNAPFAIVLFNTRGIILDCNVSSHSITGYSKEDLIGKNFRDFNFYVDIKSAGIEEREDKIKEGVIPRPRDVLLHRKDGSEFWARTNVEFIPMGEETHIQAIIQDISEQKEFEIKLAESESNFRTIFEAIPDLYFLVSSDVRILDYRGKEQELYLSPEEFMGKKIIDILPPNLSKSTVELVTKTLMTQESQNLEYELEIEGKAHFYEARYFYMSEDKVSIFIRDITDRKYIEQQISDLAKFPSENPNPVLRVDNEKVIYINKAGRDLFDLTEGNKIPNLLEEVIVKVFDEDTGKVLEAELGEKNYMFNITPILQKGYANIYGRDITERKKSEIALRIEKEFAEDILNSSMDTVFVFDPESGRAVRWNNQFREVSGYSDEEIASIKAPDLYYNEEDLKRASEAITNVLAKGTFKLEMSLITKEGRNIPYEYTATTLVDSSGDTLIVSVGRDISERKISEQKIRDSELKFRDLYEEAPIAYFSIGTDRSILRVNKAAERLLGYTNDEFLKMKIYDLYPDTDHGLKLAKEIFTQFVAGESIKDIELQMTRKKGNPIWISLSVKPIFDLEGNVIESRSMVLDITERKIAEESLRLSESRYKEAYDRGNFFKDLFAHDMNNILQVINSSAELVLFQLGDSEKSKNIAYIASIIKKQIERGAKLISNVQTLSELEDEEIITKTVEINEYMTKAINFVKRAYEGRNVKIIYENVDEKHFTNANELLQDVFENVLINGIKYNENPDIEIFIKIDMQKIEAKNYIKIEFIDNGIGVSDERKEVIFSKGNRELKGSKGMGLGLSLVSKIIDIFKGEIQVQDKIQGDYTKGSNFIILLPEIK